MFDVFNMIPVEVALTAVVILVTWGLKKLLIKDKDGIIDIPIIKKQIPVKEFIVYIPAGMSVVVSVLSNMNYITDIGNFISQVTKDSAVICASAIASYSLVIKKIEVAIEKIKNKDDENDKQDKTAI